jgi:hypothetical protein
MLRAIKHAVDVESATQQHELGARWQDPVGKTYVYMLAGEAHTKGDGLLYSTKDYSTTKQLRANWIKGYEVAYPELNVTNAYYFWGQVDGVVGAISAVAGSTLESPLYYSETAGIVTTTRPETLSNGALTGLTGWTAAGEIADDTNKATYTYSSTGAGTLTQANATLALTPINSAIYKFTYTISAITDCTPQTVTALTITSAFALTAVPLKILPGTHTVYFTSAVAASAADFVVDVANATATDTFTIDSLSLQLVTQVRVEGLRLDYSLITCLTDGAFPDFTNWTNTTDWTNDSTNAKYTHGTGYGALSQAAATLVDAAFAPNTIYEFTGTITATTKTGNMNLYIKGGEGAFATEDVEITIADGAVTATVTSRATEGAFTLYATSDTASDTFTIDTIALIPKPAVPGSINGRVRLVDAA